MVLFTLSLVISWCSKVKLLRNWDFLLVVGSEVAVYVCVAVLFLLRADVFTEVVGHAKDHAAIAEVVVEAQNHTVVGVGQASIVAGKEVALTDLYV